MNRKLTPVVPLLAIAFAACADHSPVGPDSGSHRHGSTTADAAPTQNGAKKGQPTADSTTAGDTQGGTTTSGPTNGPTNGPADGGDGGGVSTRVPVAGGFTIVIPATEVVVGYRETPYPAAAEGWCGNDANGAPWGTWTKTTKGTTSVHPMHVHCLIMETTPEQTITVAFADVATYVQSPNGNLALNFDADCASAAATVSTAQCTERFIHYKANQDRTEGRGVLTGQGSDGSVWTLDLGQVAHDLNARAVQGDGIAPAFRKYVALSASQVSGGSNETAAISW